MVEHIIDDFIKLPDIILLNIISYLDLQEINIIVSLSKTIHNLDIWSHLSKIHNLDVDFVNFRNTRAAFYKSYFRRRCVLESSLKIAWGNDSRYWERNIPITKVCNHKYVDPLVTKCAFLRFVWWLHISGIARPINSGLHHLFMCAGSAFNDFNRLLNMGQINGVISIVNLDQSISERSKNTQLNTTLCKGSPNGWYWIYIGSISLDKPNTEIKFEIINTENEIKTSSVISHVEVLPENDLSHEQKHALIYGWGFALSPGGGTKGCI
jgi:hypothetical protein